MTWNFDQDKNVAALITKQVVEQGLPILQVIHYSDDYSWAFMCGTTSNPSDTLVVSMEQAVSFDVSLYEIATMPPGCIASRNSVEEGWVCEKVDGI
ncbi:TPA: hypothetical protein I7264_25800 [Vibrio parahaemolyticus]|uniref:hypothetical protein n=1 Tax=Vibrio harveyi group TaxID=717610 RepID=UPI001A1C879E|nr:hypothetical protein [Vibrio parahaemolyticus]EHK0843136.1 hypothetical protein [Vibrio parahaemolyticus]EII3141991.1 hypothetical protein [Vibrio parahaemolyticus]EJB8409675.1 hypothetical protein [Vibrio parahaemolyticus]EJB8535531.1 hypothetical protein [Vibrio parahaemolyticus]EJX5604822.1 hypothetical protein [Vibrio parahaemolyticus]